MESTRSVMFFEKCRLCLEKPGSATICDVADLPRDVYRCTSVKISSKDNLPQKICIDCHETVRKATELRELAVKNDSALRSILLDENVPDTTKEDEIEITENIPSQSRRDSDDTDEQKHEESSSDQDIHKKRKSRLNKRPLSTECGENPPSGTKFSIKVRKDIFKPNLNDAVSSSTRTEKHQEQASNAPVSSKKKRQESEEGDRTKEGDKMKEGDKTKERHRTKDKTASSTKTRQETECEICGKTFETVKKLYMHQRTHNKNFLCPLDVCGKRFATKNDLRRHKWTHTGERPYVCDICNKNFTQPGTLKYHKESVHSVAF